MSSDQMQSLSGLTDGMRFNGLRISTFLSESKGFLAAYRGMYPSFVFGKDLDGGLTPVFVYHRIQPDRFRHHLQHLRINGYDTLSGDGLYDGLRRTNLRGKKQVALTFDDGLDDLYSVVYPLLQEFRFVAVAYIVPGWVGEKGFVTWSQVKEMHDSGLVDIQSHSMFHTSIFTSPQIIDFYHPRYVRYAPWDIPVAVPEDGHVGKSIPAYGTPIYTSNSRLSDFRRYLPEERLQNLCVSHVAKNGGDRFFNRRGWRKDLWKVVASFEREEGRTEVYEGDIEQRKSIKYEIEMSKRTIEEHLPGKVVRHFAYPWHRSGNWAKAALAEAGYRTAAGGLSTDHRAMPSGDHCFEVRRVNGDFLVTLPGIGRRGFWQIMLHKAKRRAGSDGSYKVDQST